MIPLSSQIDKYKRIVEKKEKAGKPCDIIHIVKLDDSRQSAFLIQDMFPITDEYIEREYTIAGNHLMLTSEHTATESKKGYGYAEAWCKIYANAAECDSHIRKVEAEQIVVL